MIDFRPITLEDKSRYDGYLLQMQERGCEYSFANLYLWGRQKAAFLHDHLVLFSQFNRRSVYPYPVGSGDKKPVLDAIMEDAAQRGIPCRITGLFEEDMRAVEALYPGRFRFHCDRDFFDYVYAIDDLAELKGRKYQRKRNHCNRFREAFPYYTVEPLTKENRQAAEEMVQLWYRQRQEQDPLGDFHMEQVALKKALVHMEELGMEGLLLRDGEQVLAMTMGSRLSKQTFDVHFEKALAEVDGAYGVINFAFARYLRDKYPELRFLNREDDLGLEGLRKAKLSYYPHHMVEKCWACLLEDGYVY